MKILNLMMSFLQQAHALSATPDEIDKARRWIGATFETEDAQPPFSFIYGGHSSADMLQIWKAERISHELDAFRTRHTLTYRDAKTGLEVRCVVVTY